MKNFDANAGQGLLVEVLEFIKNSGVDFLNPSSIHKGGQKARAAIEEARENILELANARNFRLIFTSGATEANNLALFQALQAKSKVAASSIEHPSVLEYLKHNFVDNYLLFDACSIADNISKLENYNFISSMWANNETGYILDSHVLAKKVKANFPKTLFHCDAVQGLGKCDFDLDNFDFVSLSAHKIGGLSGVGALLIKDDNPFYPMSLGGPQEVHHRAGTENVLGIICFGIAAKTWLKKKASYRKKLQNQREIIEQYLKNELNDIHFWSIEGQGLSNTISVQIPGIRADDLVVAMDLRSYCISSGAACASGKPEPSHVLIALGASEEAARESIRISLAVELEDTEVLNFCETLKDCVNKLSK